MAAFWIDAINSQLMSITAKGHYVELHIMTFMCTTQLCVVTSPDHMLALTLANCDLHIIKELEETA